MSARHADDQELCRQRTGMVVGRVCDSCEGRCPICDSRSNPSRPVKICDSCAGAERFAIFDTSSAATTSSNSNNNNSQQQTSSSSKAQQQQQSTSGGLITTSATANLVSVSRQNIGTANSIPSRCIICNGLGKHVAYYCRACCLLEKDRDGCPKVKVMGERKQMARSVQVVKKREERETRAAAAVFS